MLEAGGGGGRPPPLSPIVPQFAAVGSQRGPDPSMDSPNTHLPLPAIICPRISHSPPLADFAS